MLIMLWLSMPPDTLCIGDSIRMGYARYVPCAQPDVNCGASDDVLYGIEHGWTKERHWDAIIFNSGLHDIMLQVPPQVYVKNLRAIVRKLRARCNHLYFCSTTPGRVRAPACQPELVELYNCGALGVMNQEHVPVIDLHALCMAHHGWWKSDYDVHYTEAGYKAMAEYVKHALTP